MNSNNWRGMKTQSQSHCVGVFYIRVVSLYIDWRIRKEGIQPLSIQCVVITTAAAADKSRNRSTFHALFPLRSTNHLLFIFYSSTKSSLPTPGKFPSFLVFIICVTGVKWNAANRWNLNKAPNFARRIHLKRFACKLTKRTLFRYHPTLVSRSLISSCKYK